MTDYAQWNQRHKILDDEQHQTTQFLFKYVKKSHFSPSVSSMCGIIMTPCQSSFPESNIIWLVVEPYLSEKYESQLG